MSLFIKIILWINPKKPVQMYCFCTGIVQVLAVFKLNLTRFNSVSPVDYK